MYAFKGKTSRCLNSKRETAEFIIGGSHPDEALAKFLFHIAMMNGKPDNTYEKYDPSPERWDFDSFEALEIELLIR